MRRASPLTLIAVMLLAGCGMLQRSTDLDADLAPTGSIRAALNFANPLLASKGPSGGEPGGIAADLARELGRRVGRPVRFLAYDSAAGMADAARTGEWDVAFLAADPERERTITFTAAYLELDATYLVPAASRIRTLGEVDAPGVRIAARPRSAYDLFLRRSLTQAQLVYPQDQETDLDVLVSGRADILAGLRHVLADTAAGRSGLRLLDGRFAAMQQAIGTPRGHDRAAAYLREFVEDVKASGFVAKAIERHKQPSTVVAPLGFQP